MRKFINMLTQYSNKCVRSIKAIIDRYITPFIKRCFRFFRKKESVENIFIQEWVAALTENARVFNGLYSGLLRIHEGTAKNPVRILREWCQRTHYKFENQSVDTLCQEYIVPLFEEEQHDTLLKWVNLLLEAAKQAGITREEASALQPSDPL